jgi:nitroreductase
MNTLLTEMLAHPAETIFLVVSLASVLAFLLAVLQGRAVSLWPPRIEGKPIRLHGNEGSSMGVMEAIRTRKSVRAYLDRPVETEKLERILEAGRLAPSASNRQEWRFVVVREPQTRQKLSAAVASPAAFIRKAPVILAACAETDGHVMQCGQLSYPMDVAIALDHITLAAVELGLGTCWIGMLAENQVRATLGIPDRIRVVAMLTVGYPADPTPVEKKRLSLDRVAKYERWG